MSSYAADTRHAPALQADTLSIDPFASAPHRISSPGVDGIELPLPEHASSAPRRFRATDRALPKAVLVRSITGRTALIAASLAGALVFSGLTGFGSKVRASVPIADQFDRLLAGIGFAINEVAVTGHRRTLEGEIFRAIGPVNGSLLRLDVAAAQKRIEALSWIETAHITRVLPDKLRVVVTERQPFALWQDAGRSFLVDRKGRVLGPVSSRDATDLPRISGEGAPEEATALLGLLDAHPALKARLAAAHRIGGRRWDLQLANGTRVQLAAGAAAAGIDRLAALERSGAPLDGPAVVIDLRRPGRIAIGDPLADGASLSSSTSALAGGL